jgi:hypothetical protein
MAERAYGTRRAGDRAVLEVYDVTPGCLARLWTMVP